MFTWLRRRRRTAHRSPMELYEDGGGEVASASPHTQEILALTEDTWRRRRQRERDWLDELEPASTLHAHEITSDDAAVLRSLAGAYVADTARLQLPGGRVITGAEARQWLSTPDA